MRRVLLLVVASFAGEDFGLEASLTPDELLPIAFYFLPCGVGILVQLSEPIVSVHLVLDQVALVDQLGRLVGLLLVALNVFFSFVSAASWVPSRQARSLTRSFWNTKMVSLIIRVEMTNIVFSIEALESVELPAF